MCVWHQVDDFLDEKSREEKTKHSITDYWFSQSQSSTCNLDNWNVIQHFFFFFAKL